MVFAKLFEKAQKQKTKNSGEVPTGNKSSKIRKKRSRPEKRHERDESPRKKGKKSPNKQTKNKNDSNNLTKNENDGKKKSRDSRKQPKFEPPSEAALALSAKLKELSSTKSLDEVLKLYWDKANDTIRDGHHGCIVIDCCARCGSIEEGEKIFASMQKSDLQLSVETYTSLLKGYAHSGLMHKAAALFKKMCLLQGTRGRPNVRTLNTLLRGCLWTAASVDDNGSVAGGVITSEEAWALYHKHVGHKQNEAVVDSSSYEYSILLLCQALRCDEANHRIEEMKRTMNISEDDNATAGDQSAVETLAVTRLALARAYVLLNRTVDASLECQKTISAVMASRKLLEPNRLHSDADPEKDGAKKSTGGGRRAWKSKQGEDEQAERRGTSNALYRSHRLSEIESEASSMLDLLATRKVFPEPKQLAAEMLLKLFCFSGGGTTDLSANDKKSEEKICLATLRRSVINTNWLSFGLSSLLKAEGNDTLPGNNLILRERHCKRLIKEIGLEIDGSVQKDGFVAFSRMFCPSRNDADPIAKKKRKSKVERPLKIELGAGFGDWIVQVARNNPQMDFVAVEMRADRVGQIFAKSRLYGETQDSSNLCIVGAESCGFLEKYVKPGSVSSIYVNHPEPPTQTFGADVDDLQAIITGTREPAHMLSSKTLVAAARCLSPDLEAMILIVTDNRWYARLICATFVKVLNEHKGLMRSKKIDSSMSSLKQIERFSTSHNDKADVVLFEGRPSQLMSDLNATAFGAAGSSYFDRLWRTGAGSHAEQRTRFIIAMTR